MLIGWCKAPKGSSSFGNACIELDNELDDELDNELDNKLNNELNNEFKAYPIPYARSSERHMVGLPLGTHLLPRVRGEFLNQILNNYLSQSTS